MRRDQDQGLQFDGLYLVHHNLPGKQVGWHEWQRHTAFLPLQGELSIQLRDVTFTAGPGRMIYVPAGASMRFESGKLAGERLICLLDPSAWQRCTSLQPRAALCPAHQLCKEILFYLLLNPRTGIASPLVATFIQVLAESIHSAEHPFLIDFAHLDTKVRDGRLQRAVNIFRRDLDSPVRMAEVAREAGLSERSLTRLFVEQAGLPPKQVLMHCRISAARDLILMGCPVAEAARRSGYQSLTSFIAAFRRLAGQLPSEVARLGRMQEKHGREPNVPSGESGSK